MNNNMIKLNEAQLNQLVEECVMEVLNEGFFDKIGAAWKGGKTRI